MSGRQIMDDLELLLDVMPPAIRQAIAAWTGGGEADRKSVV